MNLSDDDLERRCREVIDRLLARYDWGLLDREELIHRTITAVREHPAAELTYLAFGVYNQALYDACSGDEGPPRWEQGYRELFAMLCERARRRYPDVWEDAVQSALELTCTRFVRCVVPQAFFQFAWGYVQNAARSLQPHQRRKSHHQDISVEYVVGDDDLPLLDSLPDPNAQTEKQILADERSSEIRAALTAVEGENPRARDQLAAVTRKYLDNESDEAIGQRLNASAKQVHELRSRGKKKLRTDPRMRQLRDDEDSP